MGDDLDRVRSAYDARAAEYVDLLGSVDQMPSADRERITTWRDATSGRLLDAGCGPGHWTTVLSDGGRDALGVDASSGFLTSARARFPRTHFAAARLEALPLRTASCGGVLAWYSVIHTRPDDLPAVAAELGRVLRPGGSLLLGFVDGEPGEPFDHAVTTAWSWSHECLGEVLAHAGLEVEQERRRHEAPHRPHGDLVAHRTA